MNLGNIYIGIKGDSSDARRDMNKLEKTAVNSAHKMEKRTTSALSNMRKYWMLYSAAAIAGIGIIGRSFLEAAKISENYQIRLKALLGSAEEGNKVFKDMADYASGVAFEYREIMGAATTLAGVMKGGREEIKRYMPIIADLAAVTGMGIEEVTGQVVRMYSAGAAAADMFRERGILSMLGFQAGVKYTAEETRKMLIEAWESPTSQFRDVSKELSNTWDGLMGMMADAWFQFRTKVMEAGPFQAMKDQIAGLLVKWNEYKKEGKVDEWANKMSRAIITSFQYAARGVGLFINTVRGVELVFSGLMTAAGASGEFIVGMFLKIAKAQKYVAELYPGGEWLTGGLDKTIAELESMKSELWHIKDAGAAMSNDLIAAMENTGVQVKSFTELLEIMKGTAKVEDLQEGWEEWTMHFKETTKSAALTTAQLKEAKKAADEYAKKAKELAAIEYAPPFDWEALIPSEVQVHTIEAYVKAAKDAAAIEYAPPFDWEQFIPPTIDTAKQTADQLSAYRLMYDDIRSMAWKSYEIQVELLRKQRDELLAITGDQATVASWYAEKERELVIEKNQAILESTTDMAEGMAAAWENYYLLAQSTVEQVAELAIQSFKTLSKGVGDAFAQIIVYGKNLSESFKSLMKSIAAQIISSLIDIGIQKLAQWVIASILNVKEATSRMATLAAETYAGAFAATAAIPIVGPAMAPAVASTALATMLAGSTAAGAAGGATGATIAGVAHGGLEYVPKTGTYLLEKGEGVISAEENEEDAYADRPIIQVNSYLDGKVITKTVVRRMEIDSVQLNRLRKAIA